MSPLLETIKCMNGQLFNLDEHTARFNRSRKEYFKLSNNINLKEIIEIPENAKSGLFRCRIIYTEKIEKIEFIPHQFREIKSLKLVVNNNIDYRFKYAARESMSNLFDQRGDCDDVVIVKNDCITDSYTANLVFFDGTKWYTPDTPLLQGTQREKLLKEEKIIESRITLFDISKYEKAGLINAMWDLNNMPQIPGKNILI